MKARAGRPDHRPRPSGCGWNNLPATRSTGGGTRRRRFTSPGRQPAWRSGDPTAVMFHDSTPFRLLADLLWPSACAICERAVARGGLCLRCGMCASCSDIETPFALHSARALFPFSGSVRRAVHGMKFGRQRWRTIAAGRAMAPLASHSADWVVPVPGSRVGVRHRGYDVAQLMAREIASHIGRPMRRAIVRVGDSQRQTTRTLVQRSDVGALRESLRIRRPLDGRVLLIDDVATTGATLSACARAAVDAGALQVSALTFAVTERTDGADCDA